MKDRSGTIQSLVLDTTVDTTITTAAQVPSWARFSSLFVPAITDAAVTVQIMEEKDATAATLLPSNNTGWKEYVDEAESSQIVASGVEDLWVDISHMVRAMPLNCFIRFVQGAAETSGPNTYRIAFRSD